METIWQAGISLIMIPVLLLLFYISGQTVSGLLRVKMRRGRCLLFGVFVYFSLFQAAALPMILLKRPLSDLMIVWVAALLVLVPGSVLFLRRSREKGEHIKMRCSVMMILMLFLCAVQFYDMVTSEYLAWDTSFYVGTIATSVERNSMYLYNGENGRALSFLPFRYALSGFYMHSALWCRLFQIDAIYYAKIVQGGVLAILSNVVVFQTGRFFFEGKMWKPLLTEEKRMDYSAAVVSLAVLLNFGLDTIYSSSDFLLSRGLEAKAYCANLIFPAIFLFAMMLWRDSDDREGKICLFAAMLGSVPISMSAILIAPVMATALLLPVLLKKRTRAYVGYYLCCILPNALYLLVFLLFKLKLFRIGV